MKNHNGYNARSVNAVFQCTTKPYTTPNAIDDISHMTLPNAGPNDVSIVSNSNISCELISNGDLPTRSNHV